jgi:hypothetical protein
MSNEKIKDSEYYLKDISKSLNNLNKIMSCFLVIATTESIRSNQKQMMRKKSYA